jgi:hypothetical protein
MPAAAYTLVEALRWVPHRFVRPVAGRGRRGVPIRVNLDQDAMPFSHPDSLRRRTMPMRSTIASAAEIVVGFPGTARSERAASRQD